MNVKKKWKLSFLRRGGAMRFMFTGPFKDWAHNILQP